MSDEEKEKKFPLGLKEEDFNLPASDDKGHQTKINFNAQPYLAKQVQILVESKDLPFKDKSAFYRLAIQRLCKQLLATKPHIRTVMGQVDIINRLLDDEEQAAAFESTFNKLGARISHYVGCGEKIQAVRLITDLRQLLNDMPDGFWKRKYLEEMDSKHGGFIKQVVKESKKRTKQTNNVDMTDPEEDKEE